MAVQEKMTAEQYRALADKAHQRRIESFERCDTDGFLSQFALDIQVNKYMRWAQLAENDFQDTFETLADMDGNLVPCRFIKTQFGYAYGVYESFEEAQNCGKIIKWVGTGLRAAKNKGYKIVLVSTEAKVEFSGGYSASVHTEPVNPVFTPDNCVILNEVK
jgi:hypothetical protein